RLGRFPRESGTASSSWRRGRWRVSNRRRRRRSPAWSRGFPGPLDVLEASMSPKPLRGIIADPLFDHLGEDGRALDGIAEFVSQVHLRIESDMHQAVFVAKLGDRDDGGAVALGEGADSAKRVHFDAEERDRHAV